MDDQEGINFTWCADYTRAMKLLPKELQGDFAVGIAMYGTYGTEPFFEYPMNVAFEGIRGHIDGSRKWSAMGKKSGEKRRQIAESKLKD